jgi:6-phosphogluconate dehydrogenase
MKNITLSIPERVALSRLLPKSGSRLEMVMCESLDAFIAFTPEEIEKAQITQDSGFITYKDLLEREFEFSPEQLLLIREGISQADKDRRISRDLLPIIERLEALF